MSYITDEAADTASGTMIFTHVQRCLTSMLDDLPSGMSEAQGIEAALQQLVARLAYERSPEFAARYLGGASRSLRRGDLLQM